ATTTFGLRSPSTTGSRHTWRTSGCCRCGTLGRGTPSPRRSGGTGVSPPRAAGLAAIRTGCRRCRTAALGLLIRPTGSGALTLLPLGGRPVLGLLCFFLRGLALRGSSVSGPFGFLLRGLAPRGSPVLCLFGLLLCCSLVPGLFGLVLSCSLVLRLLGLVLRGGPVLCLLLFLLRGSPVLGLTRLALGCALVVGLARRVLCGSLVRISTFLCRGFVFTFLILPGRSALSAIRLLLRRGLAGGRLA